MRTIFFVCCIVLLFMACEKNPVEEYVDDVIEAHERSSQVVDKANLQTMKKYLKSYLALNGQYPDSIEALIQDMGESIDVDKYEYDPDTGEISLR